MLLYLSLLLILFSLLLIFYNWNSNKNINFLALTFFLIAIYGLTHYVTVCGKSVFWMAILYNNVSPFMLLPGPFLYFYIRGTLNDKQGLHVKDGLHFIPSLIHCIGVIPYYLTSFSYKESVCRLLIADIANVKKIEWNVFFNPQFNFVFRFVVLSVYSVYCMYLVWKFSKNSKRQKNIPHKQYAITIRWLVSLLALITFLNSSYTSIIFHFLRFNAIDFSQNSLNTIAMLGFSLLVVSLLFFPEVLYGMPTHKIQKIKKRKTKNSARKTPEVLKKQTDTTADPFLDLYEKITLYLEKDKPYLKSDFTMAKMAADLGVPQNHVSYCINSLFNTKFSSLKIKLRIEHTKILLLDSLHTPTTIDAIAQASGFSSRSNFYNAFKEETNLTPSDYLKFIHEKAN